MSDALCIVGSYFGSTEGQQDCGSCYLINMGSVIGIIASDILLTIFIMISVFCFATHIKKRRKWDSRDGKKNPPTSSVSKKMATELTESPYQVKQNYFIMSYMESNQMCTAIFSSLGNETKEL
ncbi:hypothetical protein JOQ06_025602 [Pogonophryne albipinna]|uniref:TYRO protein tyrosine kinase-binding protein n=1 Tax=Pogonophryne albipinna TaxID=1090488 RepID=A0AAD6AV60_9TELE|nr:hypothetical protein JOQ06_025602 [Pogonophryne albipinna]